MKNRMTGIVMALTLWAIAIPLASAHTTAVTVPKTGAVLDRSPPVIEINFRQAARLTSVSVVEAGKAERKLAFTPDGSSTAFKVGDPKLGAGRSEIKWKALSMDGHAMAGTIVIEIKTPSK